VGSRPGNEEKNLAAKVADKLFFYQPNEKMTRQEIKKLFKLKSR